MLDVSLIKGKRQQQLGTVYAPDADVAMRVAQREYPDLTDTEVARLLVQQER